MSWLWNQTVSEIRDTGMFLRNFQEIWDPVMVAHFEVRKCLDLRSSKWCVFHQTRNSNSVNYWICQYSANFFTRYGLKQIRSAVTLQPFSRGKLFNYICCINKILSSDSNYIGASTTRVMKWLITHRWRNQQYKIFLVICRDSCSQLQL